MDWLAEIGNFIVGVEGNDVVDQLLQKTGALKDGLKEINNAVKELNIEDKSMKFLGMPLWNDDFWKLAFRLFLQMTVVTVIVRAIYYPIAKRKDYLFTYIMISLLVFTICFVLKKFDLGLGMALGLFAIFGIIRYRTDPIPIKEMTYLFIIIGVSVVNSLANKKMSYAELMFVNLAIIAATYGLERIWLLKHESRKSIVYEKIELIKPENEKQLIADLENRTGININRVQIGKIDFLKDTANVSIYYYEDEQTGHFTDEGISTGA